MILKEIIESVTKENYFQRDDFEDGTYVWFNLPAKDYELVLIGWTETEESKHAYWDVCGEGERVCYDESDLSIERAQIWHDGGEITDLNLSDQDKKQLEKQLNIIQEWRNEID